MQNFRFTRPPWFRRPILLAAGVACHLSLAGALIYMMVELIGSDRWQLHSVRQAKTAPVGIPVEDLTADACPIRRALDPAFCDDQMQLEQNRKGLAHRSPHNPRTNEGTGNLLWAPSGAVLLVSRAPAPPNPLRSAPWTVASNEHTRWNTPPSSAAAMTVASR